MLSVEHSVQRNFPALGGLIKFSSLHGHLLPLILGILTSLWSGLGVTNAAQNALDTVWAVPRKERARVPSLAARGLMLLLTLGLLFIVATAASGVVTGGLGGPVAKVLGIAVSLLFNVAAVPRVLPPDDRERRAEPRALWRGITVAAVFWTILQAVGGLYVGHVINGIPSRLRVLRVHHRLLVWLHLGAQITLYAAEINVVR